MKIIKQGQVPEKVLRIFRGTCARCGCQVECNENEANFSGERHPGGRQQWFINCPTKMCGSVINLQEVVMRNYNITDINKTLSARDTSHDCKIQPIKDVHTEHCCVIHGCKYGDEDCTVTTKRARQSYCCERCEDDGIRDLSDLNRVVTGITQTCPYCRHTLP